MHTYVLKPYYTKDVSLIPGSFDGGGAERSYNELAPVV